MGKYSPEVFWDNLEILKKELTRNYYRLWFSHPNVEGITWWNLTDGAFDMRLAPSPEYATSGDYSPMLWGARP